MNGETNPKRVTARLRSTLLGVVVAALSLHGAAAETLFESDFEGSLEGWHFESAESFSIVDSGDPEHGGVLEMRPQGARTHALIIGSEEWGRYRVEGEVFFPTLEHNYLGFIYNLERRENGRVDLGSVYIKGNGSYIRANPRRDWNPGRMLYEEYRTPLRGDDAIVIGQWQRFAAEVDGAVFHLYVGDLETPKITFDLFEGTRGAAGFKPRVIGGPVRLDNLRVTSIPKLSYSGPRRPAGIVHHPELLVTDWEVLGPLSRAHEEVEANPPGVVSVMDGGREVGWREFETDARGAVVTARVVDFVGPGAVAYFRTRVTMPGPGVFEFSSIDDTALWVDRRFLGYGYAERFAWHDFGGNSENAGADRVAIPAGTHTITVRVNGGRYAAGGFFARVLAVED